jgi:hypothetical protein
MKKNKHRVIVELADGIVIDAFKAGEYPQGTFTVKELSEIASTYDPSKYEAPIMIGHVSDYKGKTQIPAFGWVGKVKVVGDHLKLVASEFSDQLKKWYKEGLYKKVSIAFFTPSDPNNPTPGKWHLHHLAMLGAAPPAVKGLEGIAFSTDISSIVELSETELSIEALDAVESIADADTYECIAESFATSLSKIQDALQSDADDETKKSRMNLALSDCYNEIQSEIGLHFSFMNKVEKIEEEKNNFTEKKSMLTLFAEKISQRKQRKEQADMDAEKEKQLNETIEGLQKKVTEFTELLDKEKADKLAIELEAADKVLRSEIAQFCEKNELSTKLHKDMKLEELMFNVAKVQQTVEFGIQKKPLIDVLKDIVIAMKAVPPSGSVDFAEDPNSKKTELSIMEFAERYVKDNPKEFEGVIHEQAVGKVVQKVISGKMSISKK